MAPQAEPILDLQGTKLEQGWTVGKILKAGPIASGGHFSVCYLAENKDGQLAFMKAFDFRGALRAPDAAQALNDLTSAYLFERNLLDFTQEKNIKKVVTALFHGQITKAGAPNDSINYIVFELADGDSRDQTTKASCRDYSWSYLALHNISLALSGLHKHGIFHQDIKPSNVLVFDDGSENKIADFGRSHCDQFKSPHSYMLGAGYVPYAPPEQLYSYQMTDLALYKKAGDIYEIASMIHFFFTGHMLTPALLNKLREEHQPVGSKAWRGKFEGVIPYLNIAFEQVATDLEDQLKTDIPAHIHQKLIPETMNIFRLLGDVQPELRGRRSTFDKQNYDLQWVISKFDLMSKRAKILKKANAKAA